MSADPRPIENQPREAESVFDLCDRVCDSVCFGLQEFTTDQLKAVIAERLSVNPECWMPRLLRDYIEAWRADA